MNDRNGLIRTREQDLYGVVRDIFTSLNTVNIGVIKTVHNEDFCDVSMYYSGGNGSEVIITDVRILHPGTEKVKVIVEPDVGDYVLLLTPRDFIPNFDFPRTPEAPEEGYQPYADCNACCILIKSDGEEEDINLSALVDIDGNITVRGKGTVSLTKTNSDDEDLVLATIDENGNSTVRTKGTVALSKTDGDDGDLLALNIDEDGNLEVAGEGNYTASFKGDADITVEGGATVTVKGDAALSCDGAVDIEATQTGLITIKNSIDSLGALLAAVIDQINTFSQNVQSIDTVGSPASHSAGPGIIANMVTLQTQLAQLKQKAGQVLG